MATVKIHLDQPRTHVYTNLDNLTGKVVLQTSSQDNISEIVVKLEGVLTTKLTAPQPENSQNQKERIETDDHKILYRTLVVFPAEAVRRQQKQAASATSYTLPAGVYEYPFNFKIPINNNCLPMTGWLSKLNMSQRAAEHRSQRAVEHRRQILPPSLVCVNGQEEAKIRYYVKVTVKRASILKFNPRGEFTFVFCPVEPPRPPLTGQEIFAKREHQFVLAPKKKSKGLFASLRGSNDDPPITKSRFSIEARLPAPAIISHHNHIPLRIILKKIEEFDHPIFFRGLQLRLLSKTHVEAFDIQRDIYGAVEFFNNYNLRVPVGYEDSSVNKELEVDTSPWKECCVPTSVAPSFSACNISRVYLLEVIIGVSVGDMPHYDTIPLQIPVTVYSGIEPPKELLMASDSSAAGAGIAPQTSPPGPKPGSEKAALQAAAAATASGPSIAAAGPSTASPDPAPAFDQLQDVSAPPPTYDEATVSDLPPIQGPRREFPQGPDYFRQEKS